MAEVLSMGTMFPPEVVKDLYNKVMGQSSLAVLAQQMPVAFTGTDIFTFSMEEEVNIVGENAAKEAATLKMEPVQMKPMKLEYGARVSEEILYASEERQLEILKAFNDGCAKKFARGLDIMGMHGLNPRKKVPSAQITNHLDKGTQTVTYHAATPDDDLEAAIALLDEDMDITGVAMNRGFAAAMAKVKNAAGGKAYPEFAFGGAPDNLNGIKLSVNGTVSFGGSKDMAIIGNFRDAFKWGYAKQIPMRIIQYGDPDNTGVDLAGHNQIYLRAESYIGFAIMDDDAFARVVSST